MMIYNYFNIHDLCITISNNNTYNYVDSDGDVGTVSNINLINNFSYTKI